MVVLAVAVAVTFPLFEPEDGETVSQDVSLLLTVQLMLEATSKVCCPAADKKSNDEGTVIKGVASDCVTLIVRVIPFPLTVMVAVRCDVTVLALAETVMVLSFEPDVGETVSQDDALLFTLTVQLTLEDMLKFRCAEEAEKLIDSDDTVSLAAAASCDTLIVRVISPQLTVTVAVRCDMVGLTVAVTVMVPSSEPEEGETVSQDVALLLTFQLTLAAMVTVRFSEVDGRLKVVSDTVKAGTNAACVTLIVRTISPPLTVMIAGRGVVNELAAAVTVISPSFEPDKGETVNQSGALPLTVQPVLDVMVNDFISPTNGNSSTSADTSNESDSRHPFICTIASKINDTKPK